MHSPLRKRLLRELKGEFGKYLVIFLLLTATIGLISGFLVADGSMIVAYNESFEKYNIEDGHFETTRRLNKAQVKSVEALGVTLYDISYTDKPVAFKKADNDSAGKTIRLFKKRETVDKSCLMAGRYPENAGEIVIDRMYADNNELTIGNKIFFDDREWTVTGLVALSDYSALFSDNDDTMFDAVSFGVGEISAEDYETLDTEVMTNCYAWKYNHPPVNDPQANDMSEDFVKELASEVKLEEYIPRFANQAIVFTGDDMGSDRGMMILLLYIIIGIMAFVFAVTISNTITKEAGVIGTLRAMGYTRGELVRHYMILPLFVTIISAITGNVLGYTWFKEVCAGMYYNSYSLPTYHTIWNGEAFVLTTIVPAIMMMVINFTVLTRRLKLSPLKFLRHDFSGRKQKRAIRLNKHIPFFSRFRLRIIFQNISNYIILFAGVAFANLLLMFGLGLPTVLSNFEAHVKDQLIAQYQYMLKVPYNIQDDSDKLARMFSLMQFSSGVETENENAEKFSAYSLKTDYRKYRTETISIYGLETGSRYVPVDVSDNKIYITSPYAEKYDLSVGDTITLKEAYNDDRYDFTIDGIYDHEGPLAIYMSREHLNELFDYDKDFFCGYFSDTEITDIDEKYIGTIIRLEDLTKVSRQLTVSMGGMMGLVNGFAVLMFLVLIYLLSKIIIEKNAKSISLTKILGYTDGEISRLYILSTSIAVVFCLIVSIPLVYRFLIYIFKIMIRTEMTGWFSLDIPNSMFVEMVLIGMGSYAVIAVLELIKIRKVPMDSVLKDVD